MLKVKNSGLDQYDVGLFEQQQFGTAGVQRVNNCLMLVWLCVGVVPMTVRSYSLATTPNDTPRMATPLTAIQPSMLPPAGSASLNSETSSHTGSGGSVDTPDHCHTDGQTASHQKQTPRLLPADNFGLFPVHKSHLVCAVY